MAGEEVVGITMTAAQKSMEVTAELISKLVVPLLKTSGKVLWGATKLGAKAVAGAANSHSKTGDISRKDLLAEAAKAKSTTLNNSNLFSKDAENIAAKAKQYGIPVSTVGDGDKVTLCYLKRDKAVVGQIMQEVMQERLRTAPQEVKHFAISEQNVQALKEAFDKNGVECCFTKNSKGEVFCQYQTKDAERAQLIKEEFKATQDNVTKNFKVTPNIPETEHMLGIKAQIAEIENARKNPELRGKFYKETASDKEIKYPAYSKKNMKRVRSQMPNAIGKVAGKAFWESHGYTVSENAKGVEIVAPQMDDNGKPVLDKNGKQTFTPITVYDISETNAAEKSLDKQISDLQNEYDKERSNAFELSSDKKVVLSDELMLSATQNTKN